MDFERDTSHSFVRVRRLCISLVVSSGTRCCVFPFPRSPQRHPKLYPRPTAHGAATPTEPLVFIFRRASQPMKACMGALGCLAFRGGHIPQFCSSAAVVLFASGVVGYALLCVSVSPKPAETYEALPAADCTRRGDPNRTTCIHFLTSFAAG